MTSHMRAYLSGNAFALFTALLISAPLAHGQTGSFVKAVNINGPQLTIDNNNFAAESSSGVGVSGGSRFENQNANITPATDANRARMIRSSYWNSSGRMTVNVPVANGTYQVYLYTWEDNSPMNFQLYFENVAQGGTQSTGNGNTWKKIGPYNVAVNDGNVTILATGGHFMLSGVEIYSMGSGVPSPAPTVAPTIAPPPPPPSSAKVIFGVNGHDGVQKAYPMSEAEARFQVLNRYNLRSYRFDLVVGNTGVLDTLVPLSKKYNITLRPMIYPSSQAATYNFVKRYANDIKIWEIGNEQDYSRNGAQDRINAMTATYRGVKQASDELRANLKTTINVMACNSDDRSASARCPGDRNGVMWFLDMAKASGFNFDHVSFHWYPHFGNKGYWMDMYMGQVRAMATKFKTKVFLNETNCGEIYNGHGGGGYPGDRSCYDSVQVLFDEILTKYSDVVAEVNMYELLDEPYHSVPHERNFGLMYNLNSPKRTLELLQIYSNK